MVEMAKAVCAFGNQLLSELLRVMWKMEELVTR